MPIRWPLVILGILSLGSAVARIQQAKTGGAAVNLASYASVDASPVTTSIYVGSVSLSSDRLVRRDGVYTAGYVAKVFPFFFYNETGELLIEVSDEALGRLAVGSPIDFTGRAVRTDGRVRAVTGRAVPVDAASGLLKVRVIVSKHIVLVFNTTYRLPGMPSP